MALGDRIRRNIATVSAIERSRFRDAILKLNKKFYPDPFFPGATTGFPAGGVSYWFKQDEIHQATHVHGGPAFLPWHREICNRFEELLRDVDPDLSLHYWNWNSDPGPLFTADFMGNAVGEAGDPWLAGKFYDPNIVGENYRDDDENPKPLVPPDNVLVQPSYPPYSNPTYPPRTLSREKKPGAPPVGQPGWPTDTEILTAPTFQDFRVLLEAAHDQAHGYIGGTLGKVHLAFRDPFVFLLHSNVDRLWAMWQSRSGHTERLDPDQVYGDDGLDPQSPINAPLQPWAGESDWTSTGGWPVRPWFSPENLQVVKTCKHPSVVTPPCYDTIRGTIGSPVMALYRPGTGTLWTLRKDGTAFGPAYHEGDPGKGVGGYDLKSPEDRAFAFDYKHNGRLDHLVCYRPGTGTISILRSSGCSFSPVYQQGDPGNGIGGYDLKSPADRAIAFDYNHSGRLDHLAFYRPGTGTMWILKRGRTAFIPVYQEGDPGNGIGGYDLESPVDRAFAFDYDHSGKLDHLVLYRPGTGTIWILRNSGGVFSPVYQQGDPGNGIGGYDLKSPDDRAFAFDFDHTGKLDHLALYRPGTGTIWILKHAGNSFIPVYQQGDPGNGIGGYDLKSPVDSIFAFDYGGNGRLDHLVLYRPGHGTIWILEHRKGQEFIPVYQEGEPGNGIGGYDLKSLYDRAFAFIVRQPQ
ncbi:MAG TPA: tyrosinase family protein [Gemmatimonadaceae bacterium]|nr:tyrosinase family protein [Gemmatimonadaceae bacterium]